MPTPLLILLPLHLLTGRVQKLLLQSSHLFSTVKPESSLWHLSQMTSLPLLKLLTSFLLLSGSKPRPPAWPRSPAQSHAPAPAALPPAHLPPVPLAMLQLVSEKKHLLCAKNSSKQQSCSCEQDRQMFYPNGVQWGRVRGADKKIFFWVNKLNKARQSCKL